MMTEPLDLEAIKTRWHYKNPALQSMDRLRVLNLARHDMDVLRFEVESLRAENTELRARAEFEAGVLAATQRIAGDEACRADRAERLFRVTNALKRQAVRNARYYEYESRRVVAMNHRQAHEVERLNVQGSVAETQRDAAREQVEELKAENALMRGICSYLNWGSRTDLQDGIVVFAGYPTSEEVEFLRENFLRHRQG